MDKFYILEKDVENSNADAMLTGSSTYLEQFQEYFDEGRVLEVNEIRVPIGFNLDVDNLRGSMTDNLYMEQLEGIVLSAKAKKILSTDTNNLQFLPFVITDNYTNNEEVIMAKMQGNDLEYKTKTYENYHIANIVGLIDCINHETSNLEYYTPRQDIPEDMPEEMKVLLDEEEDNDIDFIYKLVLDEDKIPDDISIFRLKDCPRILVFKEEIVKAIRAAELTGFVFVPLSKYTDEIPDDDDDDNDEKKEAEMQAADIKSLPVEEKEVIEKPRKGIRITNIKKKQ